MRKLLVLGLVLLVAAAFTVPAVSAVKPTDDDGNYVGNFAPSGPHYNLNLIGVKEDKWSETGDELTNGNGHVIFVKMGKNERVTTKIYLKEGDDFAVLDRDGTDGSAYFQLPDPYEDGEDVTDPANSAYQIYIRVLGKPGGTGDITTGICEAEDPETLPYPKCVVDGDVYLSENVVELSSHGNNNKFQMVTTELTTVTVTADFGDGVETITAGLFEEDPFDLGWAFTEYFWQLNNQGMKLIQLRFYPVV